ncbi:sigma-54-dependent Fis family transcriptional regulator [Desulfotalea psychrophila]|uniref:Related to two-component system response regulator (Ntr family) n=1 Tax=Desulfotalea psychrophila (strain LSv54 / DSM 12343) TaxID=177439 RepID=Q6AJU9_DESPS|nr:sigma-54-dependent Fis family transcriptional regulator [Desulfotalea psychrophila]CAG37377.1 related to two-component system response regulator (Ntr family) [Desulfotalea psychrophila LSv54]
MICPHQFLVADNDPQGILLLEQQLQRDCSCTLQYVHNQDRLEELAYNQDIHILFYDLKFPSETDPITKLGQLQHKFPHLTIVPLISAGMDILVKEILGLQLFFYIPKPLDYSEVSITVRRALETNSINRGANREQENIKAKPHSFEGMTGDSIPMRQLFDLISRIADDDYSTVLIRGESGTGKEMVAKAIHQQSKRRKRNFVPVNCAAIPEELLESELFGYSKGAFTGATTNKIGRIQYADKGTLFLDEIGDMKPSLQAKLLRVLQEREFEPVGGLKATPVDTRILAATHCNLEKLVEQGRFREDLYYRLSVIPLNIPPLRERKEDLPHLVSLFVENYSLKRGRDLFSFSRRALDTLASHQWPGNVRELENLIQHMSVLHAGAIIEFDDLPEKIRNRGLSSCETGRDERQALWANSHVPPEKKPPQIEPERTEPPPPKKMRPPIEKSYQNKPLPLTAPSTSRSNSSSQGSPFSCWENGKIDFNELVESFEKQLIVRALKISSGNKKEAAILLGLKRTTLLEKIKKKGIFVH